MLGTYTPICHCAEELQHGGAANFTQGACRVVFRDVYVVNWLGISGFAGCDGAVEER